MAKTAAKAVAAWIHASTFFAYLWSVPLLYRVLPRARFPARLCNGALLHGAGPLRGDEFNWGLFVVVALSKHAQSLRPIFHQAKRMLIGQ